MACDVHDRFAAHQESALLPVLRMQMLQENNAYHALEKANGLIFTGPTGTNVNDVAVLLIDTAN